MEYTLFFDCLRVCVSTASCVSLIINYFASSASPSNQIFLGLTGFILWQRFLHQLRALKSFGSVLAPILYALRSTYYFIPICICPFLGFCQVYMSTTIREPVESIFVMFVNGVVGEVDASELEDVSDLVVGNRIEGGARTDLFIMIRAMIIFMGVTFTIAFLNVFVGVLSQRHDYALAHIEEFLLLQRSAAAVEECLKQHGRHVVRRRFTCQKDDELRIHAEEDDMEDAYDDGASNIHDPRKQHVWYCRRMDLLSSENGDGTSNRIVRDHASVPEHFDVNAYEQLLSEKFRNLESKLDQIGSG